MHQSAVSELSWIGLWMNWANAHCGNWDGRHFSGFSPETRETSIELRGIAVADACCTCATAWCGKSAVSSSGKGESCRAAGTHWSQLVDSERTLIRSALTRRIHLSQSRCITLPHFMLWPKLKVPFNNALIGPCTECAKKNSGKGQLSAGMIAMLDGRKPAYIDDFCRAAGVWTLGSSARFTRLVRGEYPNKFSLWTSRPIKTCWTHE